MELRVIRLVRKQSVLRWKEKDSPLFALADALRQSVQLHREASDQRQSESNWDWWTWILRHSKEEKRRRAEERREREREERERRQEERARELEEEELRLAAVRRAKEEARQRMMERLSRAYLLDEERPRPDHVEDQEEKEKGKEKEKRGKGGGGGGQSRGGGGRREPRSSAVASANGRIRAGLASGTRGGRSSPIARSKTQSIIK
jgi:uncharacterized membrane protein YgcG